MCRSVVVGNPWGIGRCGEVTCGEEKSSLPSLNCALVYGNIGIATMSNRDKVLAVYYFTVRVQDIIHRLKSWNHNLCLFYSTTNDATYKLSLNGHTKI